MCLIALALGQHGRFPLVVASNRDEFFERPAAPMDWWSATGPAEATEVLAGRDLSAGGSWFGLSRTGRLAMITNVREPGLVRPDAPSRGGIVVDWLRERELPLPTFWQRLQADRHNGFNLIAADLTRGEWHYASNRLAAPRPLPPGLHGLSNASLDTPWPKVAGLKRRLQDALLAAEDVAGLAGRLLEALADRRVAPDAELPRTGVPIELERGLAPAFIAMPARGYGTRCSTVLITERLEGRHHTHLVERSHDAQGRPLADRAFTLPDWPPAV